MLWRIPVRLALALHLHSGPSFIWATDRHRRHRQRERRREKSKKLDKAAGHWQQEVNLLREKSQTFKAPELQSIHSNQTENSATHLDLLEQIQTIFPSKHLTLTVKAGEERHHLSEDET